MSKFIIIVLTAVVFPFYAVCESNPADSNDIQPLKIAFLPILDCLPFHIAEEKGFFKAEGIDAKIVSVSNPVERDQLMQAGAIDGMLNELTSTALFNRDTIQVKTLVIVRLPKPKSPVFRILASPGAQIVSPKALAGIPIGVSKNTIIEYLADRMLQREGLAKADMIFKSSPIIPERFQLLIKGDLKAAVLPDPLAQAAIMAGAIPVIDDTAYPEYSLSVLTFSIRTIERNPEGVRRFFRAWDKAVVALNHNPNGFRKLFLKTVLTPKSVQETFLIPEFPRNQLPNKGQWEDVLSWLIEKRLLNTRPSFNASVSASFLP